MQVLKYPLKYIIHQNIHLHKNFETFQAVTWIKMFTNVFANRKYLKVCRHLKDFAAAFFDVHSEINSFPVQPLIENIDHLTIFVRG